tara:strand:- start:88 stop:249 length:162 start_codon:yes stop_codon:yes gene_type:complete
MPVKKVSGGYRWGSKGKVYPTRQQAEKQGAAARAAGYRGRKKMTSPKPKKKNA